MQPSRHMLGLTLIIFLNAAQFERSSAQLNYRLNSTSVIPAAYDIAVKPYLLAEDGAKQYTFDGEVNITLSSRLNGVREIILHKDYIDIISTSLYDNLGNVVQHVDAADLSYETVTDKLTVRLVNPLEISTNYTLNFKYTGQIRTGLAGFYRSNYEDLAGNSKWVFVTQLQRIDARVAFPCFDEPAFKAQFRMSINRPKQYNSVFNTRLIRTDTDVDDRYIDHFEQSPPMSTYLVAFIVSEFTARDHEDLSIIARPDYYNKTEFSHSVGLRTLQAYDEYTKLPYKSLGIPKLQNAGVPAFPHNGMENWGLIIYKDSVLVHEPGYTDGWNNKEYTITILVHEIAHMWFGNTVTFAWWSYFWLNEAFARYYQYYMAHEIYPEYQLDQQFVINQVHLIFGTDAVSSTQPMTSPESSVQTPSQIAYKFSAIAYAKGASIVRMIRNLMGDDNFDAAIRDYLKANHLQNTVPEDLFVHLKSHWPKQEVNLDEFFYDWTEQVGFPVVSVTVSADRLQVTATQKRFLLNSDDGSDVNIRYTIPITYTTDTECDFENLTPKFYFNRTDESVTLQEEKPIDWIIVNLQQSNYYRVFYDMTTLKAIRKALMEEHHSGIHVINRANLVDDLFNYGRVGLLDYDVVFEFIEYLANETEYLPWYAAFSGLQRIAQRLTLEQQNNFGSFLLEIADNVYEKLEFHNNNDTVLDVYNRNKVVSWMCKYKHLKCNFKARSALAGALLTGNKPTPDFRETVYCSGMRGGDYYNYNSLLLQYSKENLTSEKELLLRSMGCTRDFAEDHFDFILSDYVPTEQKVTGLTPLYTQNPENVTPVFLMITKDVDKLSAALGSWSSTATVISNLADYFTTKEQQKLLEDFIGEHGAIFGSSVSTLNNAVTKVEANLLWSEKHLGTVITYLDKRYGNNGAAAYGLASSLFMAMTTLYFLL